MKAMNLSKLRSLAFTLMAALFVGGASAEFKCVTRSGNVTWILDHAGLIKDAGLAIDDPVEYVIAVDTETEGQLINDDGAVHTAEDIVLHAICWKGDLSDTSDEGPDSGNYVPEADP